MIAAEEALRAATARLADAGIEAPRREARLLLLHALEALPESLVRAPERLLAPAEADIFADLVARRAAREPMSQIIGRREFWSLNFRVSSAVLTPRPDSGTLIRFISLFRFTSTMTMSSLPSRLPAKARSLPSGDQDEEDVM